MYLFISVGEHRVSLLALMGEVPQPKLAPQGGAKPNASGETYRRRYFQNEGDVRDLGCQVTQIPGPKRLCVLATLETCPHMWPDSSQSFLRTHFSVYLKDVLEILVLLEKCLYL